MRMEDIPFAIHLSNQEKWGVTKRDLTRILSLDRRGSFIAHAGSKRVGLVTTTTYGNRLAWIGNVIVDREHRGKHIGRALVKRAIQFLQEARIRHIAVYCFDENVRFYRRLGFVRDVAFLRLNRKAKRTRTPLRVNIPQPPLRIVLSADRRAFGADRSRLIRKTLVTGAAWYLGFSNATNSASYLLVKEFDASCEFGPWVCIGPAKGQPEEMLNLALAKTADRSIELSCLQGHESKRLLLKAGFHVSNHGYRMYLDTVPRIGNTRANYALGFLDKG